MTFKAVQTREKYFNNILNKYKNEQHDSKQQNADQQRSRQQKNDNHQEL